jgi:hypothetical protein
MVYETNDPNLVASGLGVMVLAVLLQAAALATAAAAAACLAWLLLRLLLLLLFLRHPVQHDLLQHAARSPVPACCRNLEQLHALLWILLNAIPCSNQKHSGGRGGPGNCPVCQKEIEPSWPIRSRAAGACVARACVRACVRGCVRAYHLSST